MFKKGSKVVRKDGIVGEVIEIRDSSEYKYPIIACFSSEERKEESEGREKNGDFRFSYTLKGACREEYPCPLDIALLEDENQAGKAKAKPFLVNRYNIDEGIASLEQAMLEVFFQEKRELILQEELEEKRTLVLKDDLLTCSQAENTCLWQASGDFEILQQLEDKRRKYLAYKRALIPLTLTVEQVQLLIKASLAERAKLVKDFIGYTGKEFLPGGYSMAIILQWYETYCL